MSRILVRPARHTDRAFVLQTAVRLEPAIRPAWRPPGEIPEGEVRTLAEYFDVRPAGVSLLIAELDHRLAGFVYIQSVIDYFTNEEHGHVGILAVTAEAEGAGVGGALLRAAETWARERGYRMLSLNVFDTNVHARAVYEHVGYVPETIRYVKIL